MATLPAAWPESPLALDGTGWTRPTNSSGPNRNHSRRSGVNGLVSIVLGMLRLLALCSLLSRAQAGLTYIRSEDGLLETELTVVKGPAMVGGMLVEDTVTFNGLYPGPVLVMRRGDRVRIRLLNALEDSDVNIHFHGFHITPEGTGDNVAVRVPPGGALQYDFFVPETQDQGLFWLHGHVFGLSDHHVSLGLSSLLVVNGGAADLLPDSRRVLMAINEMQITNGRAVYPPNTPTWEHTFTVNGERMPVFTMRPGETQLWQIGNLGANTYLRLQVEGHGFTVLEVDGGLLYNSHAADDLFLYQGRRMGVAITASRSQGDYQIRTLGWDGGVFNNYTSTDMAVLRVEGPAVDSDQAPPHIPPHPRPPNAALFVPAHEVAAYRTFILSENSPEALVPEFYINSMLFSDRTPSWTPHAIVDTTEEWLIAVSNSPTQLQDPHVWHVHTNPFAIVGRGQWDYRDGVRTVERVQSNGTQDVIYIEPGTYVLLRTHLADFVGRPVLHCHLLFHEDFGMMTMIHIHTHANPALCGRNYAQARADCERNHPLSAVRYHECRQSARQADRVCRARIPRDTTWEEERAR